MTGDLRWARSKVRALLRRAMTAIAVEHELAAAMHEAAAAELRRYVG